ncbi:MAG: class I tRNA ligase family protein, partial [Patescibacteria group bacterium]
LVAGITPGRDSAISEDKIRGYRNFSTKLWNIARFIAMQQSNSISKTDKAHLKKLATIKNKVTKHLESYEFHLALETIYHYVWHEFADVIIEDAKRGEVSRELLIKILEECLIMLHPFMPFVTEEIYQTLCAKQKELLMTKKW